MFVCVYCEFFPKGHIGFDFHSITVHTFNCKLFVVISYFEHILDKELRLSLYLIDSQEGIGPRLCVGAKSKTSHILNSDSHS